MTRPLLAKIDATEGEMGHASLLEGPSAILSFLTKKEFASHFLLGRCPYGQRNKKKKKEKFVVRGVGCYVFYAITVVSSLKALNEIKEELIAKRLIFKSNTKYHTNFPGFGETSYMTFKGDRKHVRIDFSLSLNLGMLPKYSPAYSNFKSLKE